jgi:hypothetical protein
MGNVTDSRLWTGAIFLIKAQFVHCDFLGPNSWATYAQVPVTYRVLGLTHHAWVPLELPIAVRGVANACGSR